MAIINPRGPGGSGKTELARRILFDYGWLPAAEPQPRSVERLYRPGRELPFGYRLKHPAGGNPLVVLGDYSRRSGGCDTIREADGGLRAALELVRGYADEGHDVLIEGLQLSADTALTIDLARSYPTHVLLLETSPDRCARNLAERRRTGRRGVDQVASRAAAEFRRIEEASRKLQPHAAVEVHGFESALARARELLGVPTERSRQGSRIGVTDALLAQGAPRPSPNKSGL